MVASGPRKSLLELESRGERQESSQTPVKPAFNAKRREQKLSALAVYQCVGQFRGQNISSRNKTRTSEIHNIESWHPCESTKPPPYNWPPQGDHTAQDPLVHPSGSLHFYAEIRGFCETPILARLQTTGRAWPPISTPKGSDRGQRLKTTGRPPNTSRTQKPCKTRHFRVFEQARGFSEKRQWQ